MPGRPFSYGFSVSSPHEIDEVAWEITGGDMAPMSGTVDTSAPGSTASVEVFGIPEGDFVVMLEATATDGETTCGGAAPFSVVAGQVTEAHVLLRCKLPSRFGGVRVNGKLNICAELTKVVVSPLQTSVGNVINLMADAVDAEDDPIEYAWTALVGTIADPGDPITIYTCTAEGSDEITIPVSDDGGEYCMSQWTVPVTCVGDGGGTGGTGGAAGSGGEGGTAGFGGTGGAGGAAGEGGTGGSSGAGGTGGAAGTGGDGGAGGMAGGGGMAGAGGAGEGGKGGAGGIAGAGGQDGTGGGGCDCDCDSDSDTDSDSDSDSDTDEDSDSDIHEGKHPHKSWKHWYHFWKHWWND